MTRLRKLGLLHTLCLSIFPVFFLYSYNTQRLLVSPSELVTPTIVAAGCAVLIGVAFGQLLRNTVRGALLATTLVVAFWAYGHVYNGLRDLWSGTRPWMVLALFLLAVAIVAWSVAKSRREFEGLTLFLNGTGVILLLVNVVGAVPGAVRGMTLGGVRKQGTGVIGQSYPDVYWIILDGYGRSDVLKRVYDYDNGGLIRQLDVQGFYVAHKARANYAQTTLSLASALNLNYLDSLAEEMGPKSDDRRPLVQMVHSNPTWDGFRAHGYRFVAFASGVGLEFKEWDRYLSFRGVQSEFDAVLIGLTPIPALLSLLTWTSEFEPARKRIRYQLEQLPKAGELYDEPVLAFCHILSPHPPFIFRADGSPSDPIPRAGDHLSDGSYFHHMEPGLIQTYRNGYREQAEYVTIEVRRLLDRILERSGHDPVIILQSDHGPGSGTHWDDERRTDFDERLPILMAVRFPDRNYSGLSDSSTPINVTRTLLNRLFDRGLVPLPDRSYFSTWNQPYSFIDVDHYEAEAISELKAVSAVTFWASRSLPEKSGFWREVVNKKFPGAQMDSTYVIRVERYITLEEAVGRYREAVRCGSLPDLGDRFAYYRGRGPNRVKIVTLYFPSGDSADWHLTGEFNCVAKYAP